MIKKPFKKGGKRGRPCVPNPNKGRHPYPPIKTKIIKIK